MDYMFWEGLIRLLNKYFSSCEDKRISNLSIDAVFSSEVQKVSAVETRIIAESCASEGDGRTFINYKISIAREVKSVQEFENSFPFKSWEDLNGKININMAKNRIVINAT